MVEDTLLNLEAELVAEYPPLPRALLPSAGIVNLSEGPVDMLRASKVESYTSALTRAMEPSEALAKSLDTPPSAFSFTTMSYMPDPQSGGLTPWPGIAPGSLERLARTNLAPEMIIATRISDVLRYSTLSSHPWKPGWRIEMIDKSSTPTTWDRRDMRAAEMLIENSCLDGTISNPRERDQAGFLSFKKFLAMVVRDYMVYDSIALWTDLDNRNRIKGYAPLPAGNIRLADPKLGYMGNPAHFAALLDQAGCVVEPFTRDELVWHVGNPKLDPSWGPYGWSRLDAGMRLVDAFQSAFDMNADVFTKFSFPTGMILLKGAGFSQCFDEKTEVLTSDGWKSFEDVDIESDQFATQNIETGEFEWQSAHAKVWEPYSGPMYTQKSRSIDLLVTPNHRVLHYWRGTKHGHIKVTKAAELFETKHCNGINFCLPATSNWTGTEAGDQFFKGIDGQPDITMSWSQYFAFMAMALSEGFATKNGLYVYVSQRTYSKGFEPMGKVLFEVFGDSVRYMEKNATFMIKSKVMNAHLAEFGSGACNKFIPPEIMNATKEQINYFLYFFLLGDGRYQQSNGGKYKTAPRGRNKGVFRSIGTSSKKLAGQFQELIQKTGQSATIYTEKPFVCHFKFTDINGVDQEYDSNRKEHYTVSWRGTKGLAFKMEKVEYTGHIGCVSVPNGTLYVRRNGKAAWSGNSELDAISRQVQNLKKGVSKIWSMPAMVVPKDSDITFLDLNASNDKDIQYQNHMNLVMGVFCLLYGFPHRRMGFRISGAGPDADEKNTAMRVAENSPVTSDEDIGLINLLGTLEFVLNQYIIQTRFPHLQLVFSGKAPREDAREYEAKSLAKTWGERRAETDLCKLEDLVEGDDLKKIAKLMSMAPVDPSLAGVFQSIAAASMQGENEEKKEAMFPSSGDPARAEAHGALSGVRRHSKAESPPNTP